MSNKKDSRAKQDAEMHVPNGTLLLVLREEDGSFAVAYKPVMKPDELCFLLDMMQDFIENNSPAVPPTTESKGGLLS